MKVSSSRICSISSHAVWRRAGVMNLLANVAFGKATLVDHGRRFHLALPVID